MMAGWGGSRSSFRHVLLLLYLMQKMGSLSLSHSLSWMNEGMAKFGAMSCPIFMGAISARSGMYQTTFLYVLRM